LLRPTAALAVAKTVSVLAWSKSCAPSTTPKTLYWWRSSNRAMLQASSRLIFPVVGHVPSLKMRARASAALFPVDVA